MTVSDQAFMSRALRLAALGRHASPNPMVGCVIVSPSGEIVGQGFHPKAGEPHAEVFALRAAGTLAKGATAYVTLEPCAHHGRTPPCADALIAAGVRRVFVALQDPDPRVSGQGIARVKNAGIDVHLGLCAEQAAGLIAAYLKHRRTGLPFVAVKIAMTLDGRIATEQGDSQWITSEITRRWVHRQLRDRADAILVGIGTVLADDPSLTTRLAHKPGRNPIRIVVDSQARTPLDSNLVKLAGDGKTWIAHTDQADPNRLSALIDAGVKLLRCTTDNPDSNYKNRNQPERVNLSDLLAQLGTQGDIVGVLVEGGSELIGSLLKEGLVDRYIAAIAPKIVGGKGAPGPVGGAALAQKMESAVDVVRWNWRRSGPDLVVDARLR
ncbi:MAG TPA: bifunctional diaminohydroxyphosphoribosylaminopyrimidine deaminase/5-amino-6-(5-phosphoribosylamino)uracil reductase RibD [Capsulimonadaceae bacterium]|nr:bifunctional diaminohydroxyphosphoribosylaminopyrimidine deaminase/5-amino-6-(5-phosphoribosylamino)uracil reductase RibD [Capsulimonadaceae bacterium]